MAVVTRSASNNNARRGDPPQRRGKEPVRNPTPDGFLQDVNEEDQSEEEKSVSSPEGRPESRQEQPDLTKAVQDFLEAYKAEFQQFLSQGRDRQIPHDKEGGASSRQKYSSDRRQKSSRRASPSRTPRNPIQGSSHPVRNSPPRNKHRGNSYRHQRRGSPHHAEQSHRSPPHNNHRSPVRHLSPHRRHRTGDRGQHQHHVPVAEPNGNGGFNRFNAYGRITTPFSEEIIRADLPARYRTLNVPPYNGLCDPHNFLGQFQYCSLNQKLSEVDMCKIFPELLIDNARIWFDSLPAGSITSYEDLMDAFHIRFFQRAAPKTTSAHLLTIRQARDEPISDFLTRFNKESLKVANVNDLLVISAFQNGILPGALYREIVKNEPQTVTELWDIAGRFAKADEADRMKREADRPKTSDKKKKDEDRGGQEQSRRSVHDRIQRGTLQSRLGPQQSVDQSRPHYTPLTRSRTEIYELHPDMFEKPHSSAKSSKRRPKDKYCSFHDHRGHDTEECRDLAAGIDSLVKDGTLRKYRGRGKNEDRSQGRNKSKRRQSRESRSGKSRSCSPLQKNARRDSEEDEDAPQFDGVVTVITGPPPDMTEPSLEIEA